MPFFLDGNPTQSEVSEAVNYLLSNFTQNVSADPNTGQVIGPTGNVQGYLYRYLSVKYADSFDGSVNFTNTPTNRGYYGLRNSDSSTESTNPADYLWTKVTGGFSTTKLFYYTVTGGRQINYIVGLSAPSALWQSDSGTAIDLDVISGSDGASSRICYAKSTSFSLSATPATYQTTGNVSFPPYNTWSGSETWQAGPPTLAVNEALFQSDGIYNPTTNLTTWNVPYLSNLRVGSLSAISANLGTITAGTVNSISVNSSIIASTTINTSDISSGSSPAISGTGMTGSGIHLYNDGRIAIGNSTSNVVWNNSGVYIQGNLQSNNYVAATSGWQILNSGSAEFNGVVLSRQLQIDSGAGYIGSNYYVTNTNDLQERDHFFIETNTAASAWSGTTKTMIALLSGSGSVSANAGDVASQPQNIQWGFHADVAPITRWSGAAKIWIKCNVDTRLVNFLVGGFVINWQLFQVT
jgi:hypothetical protein